jgi:hypothetical protein
MPAFTIAVYVFMTSLLGIRLASRLQRGGSKFGIDDVFILLAWAIATASSMLVIISTAILFTQSATNSVLT